MRISTKGRYALRLLLDLAQNQGKYDFVSLKDIAKRQEISKKYLEQIVSSLNKANMLITVRGAQGGYRLAREPKDYSVGEVLRATEGNIIPVSCVADHESCDKSEKCDTRPFFQGLSKAINNYCDSINLQMLLNHDLN